MPDRDPRTEPWSGDALRGQNGKRMETRTVHAVIGGNVYYRLGARVVAGYLLAQKLEPFRRWSKTAEIISRGDEHA